MANTTSASIIIPNARLSFPSLYKTEVFNGEDTGKYACTLLIPKDAKVIETINGAIAKLQTENKVKIQADKICLKDGDYIDYNGYADHFSIKATNKRRIQLVARDGKTPLVEADNVFYSGCYVNAVITLWLQNNSYGKRINANLLGLQFAGDGEAFGEGAPVDVTDAFADLSGGEDDFG